VRLRTKFVRSSWQAFLTLVLIPPALSQSSAPHVEFTPLAERIVAKAGEVVTVRFEATLPAGFHVNSDAPNDEFLRPTRLSLETLDGVAVDSIEYPQASLFKTSFSDEPLSVYEEKFVITANLEVASGAKLGELAITATLKYQVCSASVCYRPATRTARLILAVGGPSASLLAPFERVQCASEAEALSLDLALYPVFFDVAGPNVGLISLASKRVCSCSCSSAFPPG